MASLLQLNKCTIRFGGLTAVSNLDLSVDKGELVGLIGPNGAGKTTVFNMITGVYRPTEGEVLLEDKRLNGLKPYAITAYGIARTFQNIRLFSSLTVFDNVRAAFNLRLTHGPIYLLTRGEAFLNEESEVEKKTLEF